MHLTYYFRIQSNFYYKWSEAPESRTSPALLQFSIELMRWQKEYVIKNHSFIFFGCFFFLLLYFSVEYSGGKEHKDGESGGPKFQFLLPHQFMRFQLKS